MIDLPHIAVTDLETTGLDPAISAIIEIGLVVVRQPEMEIVDTWEVKVRPEKLELALQEALDLNQYSEAEWEGATDLKTAIADYAARTSGMVFCAHNVTFDWSFMSAAFRETGVTNSLDYHRLDLFTMAWLKLRQRGLARYNLNAIAKLLGVPEEPMPHRALNGALTAAKVLQKLGFLE